MKVLVAGWFSFPEMGATAGDLLTRDVVCGWLAAAGRTFDVALAGPFPGGVDWQAVEPTDYSDVVFVCGPFGNGWPIPDFLDRFKGRRFIGVNLSMLEPLDQWNPFDVLLERDSSTMRRPDLVLMSNEARVPVVGVVLVHAQREYPNGAHAIAHEAVHRLVASRPMAAVRIDTRLDVNATGLRRAGEVETLIARMDLVITTRLHGLVLAIKNGVPAVAIDPIAGGAKLRRQADVLGWPMCFPVDDVTDEALASAFEYTLTPAARHKARECGERGRLLLTETRDRFMDALAVRLLA